MPMRTRSPRTETTVMRISPAMTISSPTRRVSTNILVPPKKIRPKVRQNLPVRRRLPHTNRCRRRSHWPGWVAWWLPALLPGRAVWRSSWWSARAESHRCLVRPGGSHGAGHINAASRCFPAGARLPVRDDARSGQGPTCALRRLLLTDSTFLLFPLCSLSIREGGAASRVAGGPRRRIPSQATRCCRPTRAFWTRRLPCGSRASKRSATGAWSSTPGLAGLPAWKNFQCLLGCKRGLRESRQGQDLRSSRPALPCRRPRVNWDPVRVRLGRKRVVWPGIRVRSMPATRRSVPEPGAHRLARGIWNRGRPRERAGAYEHNLVEISPVSAREGATETRVPCPSMASISNHSFGCGYWATRHTRRWRTWPHASVRCDDSVIAASVLSRATVERGGTNFEPNQLSNFLSWSGLAVLGRSG